MQIDSEFEKILELMPLLDANASEKSEVKELENRIAIYEKICDVYQSMLDKYSDKLFEYRKELRFYYRTYPQARQQYLNHLQHE